MMRRSLFPLFLMAVLAAAAVSEFGSSPAATAGTAVATQPDAIGGRAAGSSSLTAEAVSAARAFTSSLRPSQRATVQYSFDDAKKKVGWSNLPVAVRENPPNGVAVGDLSATQRVRLRALLRVVLSSTGYQEEEAIRVGDDYLNRVVRQPGFSLPPQPEQDEPPPPGPPLTLGELFSSGKFNVAFFGTPSTGRRWTLQFGGHHLAIHVTFAGATVSNTPYFMGVEPLTFAYRGKRYAPMSDEARALFGAVRSLDGRQLAAGKLSATFDDVLLGPGKDDTFPRRQGVLVSSLSASQRRRVTRAVRAWVGDVDSSASRVIVRRYVSQFSRTRLSWATSTDPSTTGAYARLHGPRLWIEIVTQAGIVVRGPHYHSMHRDTVSDYGETR